MRQNFFLARERTSASPPGRFSAELKKSVQEKRKMSGRRWAPQIRIRANFQKVI